MTGGAKSIKDTPWQVASSQARGGIPLFALSFGIHRAIAVSRRGKKHGIRIVYLLNAK